ncbi:exocyst complex component 1 [Cimex lectularius]|uniref:Exocyst complex component Sec3 PIP2-binding N-terminal domain-containing protein n=1 Tax=Cimex lectularius TaxID=79782 RepID=A0A8I6TF77_CIMLE|nr:exocyst complex component 1 [Cimex lectularius]
MAAIRHSLQHEVFQPCDERLLAFVHVSKALKKKKSSFLCIAVTKETPFAVNIYQVKKTEKNIFKKKRSWSINSLKFVDGKCSLPDTSDFDLYFDKVYKWSATNPQERQNFIIVLWKQCYQSQMKPEFKNVPSDWIAGDKIIPFENQVTPVEPVEAGDFEEFQALTEKEENDLVQLMHECGFTVSNAEAFMETLAKDLSILDGENVQSVLASEERVSLLMAHLDEAIEEVERVEKQLDHYDDILCHVRNTMEKMEEKNMLIEISNRNNQKLLNELGKVILELELDSKHQAALVDADLTSPQGLRAAIEAGKALQAVMNAEIHPALVQLSAVQEQKKRFDKWKSKFSQIITRHLNNLFIHLGNDAGDQSSMHGGELVLPKHASLHRELRPYTELMHWAKAMDRRAYNALADLYTSNLRKVYERDIHHFLEDAKNHISGPSSSFTGSKEDMSKSKKEGTGQALLGIERDQWPESDEAERTRFHQVFEKVLSQLEPVCLSEQQFCVYFFQLDILSPTSKNTQTTLDGLSSDSKSEETVQIPMRKVERQMNEEVRKMMGEIFRCIEPGLISFISHYEQIDSMFCLYTLVRLSEHVMTAQDAGSFLSKSFGPVLIQVKRTYDRYMQSQLQSILDCRGNRKSKCGILPFVSNFEVFAKTAEKIFRNTSRRGDLDKWYVKLVGVMFEAIPSIANDHPKTPPEVIKMENFHHLFDLLSQLKIPVLDTQRKDAKVRYNESLKAYVTRYFGRPLEKLNQFFEGVQAKVGQGVKESEISYQMAYSKQELRKLIKEYPAKEVKRGLDHLYKKVEKHLCEEENLLQVVWRAMQEEFIQQYKYIEDLIQRCYPGAMITLEFSIDDILNFFSEIARSH